MGNAAHKLILLPNRSYQATVRSEIKKLAAAVEFSAKRMAELEIVIAEITSNIIKHTAAGGELLVKILQGNSGIEIISIDNGPGMTSVGRMMEDGISSTQTLGQGLGAIKRLSDDFDVYSQKGWGTVLLCRFYKEKQPFIKRNIQLGVLMLPKDGETVCGDDYNYSLRGNILKLALSDGLGHGKDAHIASVKTTQIFMESLSVAPDEQIRQIHAGSRKTRGAVMYTMHLDIHNKQLMYCGVGNIAAKIVSGGTTKSCVSYNGIVGHIVPGTLNNHTITWNKQDLLVVHSDGLSGRWELQKYPFVSKHDATIIAAVLYKDFCRKNDDVTVIVCGQFKQ